MDFIAAFFAKFFHGHHVCPWDQFESTTIHFCEERVCAYVVQPANSYSCFAFVFAGLWLIAAPADAAGCGVHRPRFRFDHSWFARRRTTFCRAIRFGIF